MRKWCSLIFHNTGQYFCVNNTRLKIEKFFFNVLSCATSNFHFPEKSTCMYLKWWNIYERKKSYQRNIYNILLAGHVEPLFFLPQRITWKFITERVNEQSWKRSRSEFHCEYCVKKFNGHFKFELEIFSLQKIFWL